ncbi:MAG: RecX family transcriptional regulator [Clostridia bacterium]|nr:RecX family transcriptional regulator [Clostridia bacterium]
MRTVTAITAQQKNKKRVNLYLDGEYYCSVELFTVMSERLKVGSVVDEKRLSEIIEKSDYTTCLDKATAYISKSMKTKSQVVKYLLGKGYDKKTIAKVIDKLIEYGYVDDQDFVRRYVDEKKSSSGKRKIMYELKIKGVDDKVIDHYDFEGIDQLDACYSVAQKYLRGKPVDFPTKQKCYRYLISKGFDWDTAKSAVERLEDESNNS